jgi:hypothetical protein
VTTPQRETLRYVARRLSAAELSLRLRDTEAMLRAFPGHLATELERNYLSEECERRADGGRRILSPTRNLLEFEQ